MITGPTVSSTGIIQYPGSMNPYGVGIFGSGTSITGAGLYYTTPQAIANTTINSAYMHGFTNQGPLIPASDRVDFDFLLRLPTVIPLSY